MSAWRGLFPGTPEGGKEGTLPFRFENFGTFAGPQFSSTNYDFDKLSEEGAWYLSVPGDAYTFTNLDLGAYLFNNETNYVGFHCDGVATSQMYLQHSAGNIPIFNVFADTTNVMGNINSVGDITTAGDMNCIGNFTYGGAFTMNGSMTLSGVGDLAAAINSKLPASSKGFDIEHPKKKGHRLRHICVEGPEAGPIYVRGKLEDNNIIVLPDYWDGLIDKETITVHLTPMGVHQELFVEKIEWGKNVFVKNGNGGPIKCYYQIWADRDMGEKLHVEYEGETPADYPGDQSMHSIAGYDYDRRQN